jgi:hypothetical protein
MLELLIKVAETLLSLSSRLQQANADRRRNVSLYFENLSRCLSEIAEALKSGVPPSRACGELREYSVRYNNWDDEKNPIAAVFGEDLAKDISSVLRRLVSTRGGAMITLRMLSRGLSRGEDVSTLPLYGLLYYGDDRYYQHNLRQSPEVVLAESISKIEQAAGKFKALSVIALTSR